MEQSLGKHQATTPFRAANQPLPGGLRKSKIFGRQEDAVFWQMKASKAFYTTTSAADARWTTIAMEGVKLSGHHI